MTGLLARLQHALRGRCRIGRELGQGGIPTRLPRRNGIALVVLGVLASVRLATAQCPDGRPPPCAGEPRARQEALRRTVAAAPDSATALVVPLSPVGTDTSLRRLGADLAAIIADNVTVGEVRARVAGSLARLATSERPRAAARQRAGALVEGSITRAGALVRATARLVEARSARQLATITVEGSPDSLLALADRVSVVFLKAWWKAQPGPHFRGGLTTSSLPALRNYVAAMAAWRRGDSTWVALLDSAVHRDRGFVAAWLWLGLPRRTNVVTFGWSFGDAELPGETTTPDEHVGPDSARRALGRTLRNLPPEALREAEDVASHSMLAVFAPGGLQPPTRRDAEPFLCTWSPSMATVEERHMVALALRAAVRLGCSDSTAIRVARSAHELDPAFAPARELLFDELLAAGDTAGAGSLLRPYPGADTLMQTRLRSYVRLRLSPFAPAASLDSVIAGMFFVAWRRFREAPPLAAVATRGMTAQIGELADRLGPAFRVTMELPTMVALGRLDSARAVVRAASAALAPQGGPQRELRTFGPLAWFPPDTALVHDVPDAPWLDSLGRRLQALEGRPPLQHLSPEAARLRLASARARVLRASWFAGALALQRGDTAVARRALCLLDSARGADSALTDPLADGLRAELALAAGDGAAAESLLVETVTGASPHPPGWYVWLLAWRYAQSDQPGLALRLARSLTRPTSWFYEDDLVLDGAMQYARALKLEGEMLDRLGRRDEALERYREFADLRAGADPPLQPEVAEVRARIARAGGGADSPPD